MTFLRSIAADLVEKRLWPIAVVLGLALVAVPVVVGAGSSEEAGPGPTAAPLAGSPGAVVRLAEAPASASRAGADRNPFKQPGGATGAAAPAGGAVSAAAGAAAAAAATTSEETSSGGTSSAGSSAGGPSALPSSGDVGVTPVTGGGGSSTSSPPAAPRTTGSTAKAKSAYGVTLRFGAPGALSEMKDVPRLAPLPSSEDPFIVFLGVGQDGKTAVFLVASDASVTGEGRCKPATSDCQTIELAAGQTAYFDLDLGDQGVKQFQLDLLTVESKTAPTKALAAAAKARESARGRRMLRAAIDSGAVDISELDYDAQSGTLVHSAADAKAQAKAADGVVDAGYAVAIHAGGGDRPRVEMDLKRLTPLANADNPFLIYLGVLEDGQTAVFANPFQAAATGGTCKPTPEECKVLELKAGETATLDLDPGEGKIDYPVQVDTVTQRKVGSAAEAAQARLAESAAGREFLRDGIKAGVLDLDGLEYDAASGTLRRP